MTHNHQLMLGRLMMGGFIVAGAVPACAQSPDGAAVVRISDGLAGNVQQTSGAAAAPCPTCQPNGYSGGYTTSNSYCPDGRCPPGARHAGLFHHHHHDMGFSVPVKHPIYRTGVAYQHWMKSTNAPYEFQGAPVAPLVYMPTDTTQLGYYYQHVPYWQPQAGRIPQVPNPAEWHHSLYGTLGHSHPQGVILGTAPQALPGPAANCPPGTPNSPPETPYNPQPVPMQNSGVVPHEAQPVINGVGLDRAAIAPELLPISPPTTR